jgi:hypothetical protein
MNMLSTLTVKIFLLSDQKQINSIMQFYNLMNIFSDWNVLADKKKQWDEYIRSIICFLEKLEYGYFKG